MDLVLGTEAKPDPIVASGVTTNQAAINSWNHKDNTAQLLILVTICSDHQRSLIICTSATQMWKRFISQFEQSASENKMFLFQQFLNYQYKEGHDISSHVTAIELMASQLQEVGSPVSDVQVITKVVSTLPPSYRHVIAAWENLDDSKKTINLLRARLMKQEAMNQQYGEVDTADAAFFAKRFDRSTGEASLSGKQEPSKPMPVCNYWK
jgi:hypothetical protein